MDRTERAKTGGASANDGLEYQRLCALRVALKSLERDDGSKFSVQYESGDDFRISFEKQLPDEIYQTKHSSAAKESKKVGNLDTQFWGTLTTTWFNRSKSEPSVRFIFITSCEIQRGSGVYLLQDEPVRDVQNALNQLRESVNDSKAKDSPKWKCLVTENGGQDFHKLLERIFVYKYPNLGELKREVIGKIRSRVHDSRADDAFGKLWEWWLKNLTDREVPGGSDYRKLKSDDLHHQLMQLQRDFGSLELSLSDSEHQEARELDPSMFWRDRFPIAHRQLNFIECQKNTMKICMQYMHLADRSRRQIVEEAELGTVSQNRTTE